MGIINSNKSIGTVTAISCEGTLDVTLGITAAPDIVTNPTDIVLILDRSGSMEGSALASLKNGVDAFIDIIAEATDGAPDEIGSGSHIGIVSFANTATQDTGLITSVADLKAATAALVADGNTNHGDAFSDAADLLSTSTNNKVMVMFTDGETTTGPNPSPIAAAARAAGNTIYCIGLVGSTGIDENALNDWATLPSVTHVAIAPTDAELQAIFADLAENLSVPGATNIVIAEAINPDFIISSPPVPSVGTISAITDTSFNWEIAQLGATVTESATLTFSVQHVAGTPGVKHVDQSITYSDTEGNVVSFADPTVFVECPEVVIIDVCPAPVDITIEGCEELLQFDAGDLSVDATGRILQLDVTLFNVCPNRRVALGVALKEIDAEGVAHARGLKTFTIPAHQAPTCQNVLVECIRFVLPEDLNVSADGNFCGPRNFQAQFFSNYVDAELPCCPPIV